MEHVHVNWDTIQVVVSILASAIGVTWVLGRKLNTLESSIVKTQVGVTSNGIAIRNHDSELILVKKFINKCTDTVNNHSGTCDTERGINVTRLDGQEKRLDDYGKRLSDAGA
mgnify:CR=1 FL=1